MEKNRLLTILVGITLITTVLNLYATMNLYVGMKMMATAITTRQQRANAPAPSLGRSKLAQRQSVSLGGASIKGIENAPVTLIEFSDYQCPFSAKFFSETLPQIEKNYIKTGKVKMAFRNYPLQFHQFAQKAAEAAECAAQQGKFWECHDTIFENQKDLSPANLKQLAQKLGLDSQKFNQCLDSGTMANKVKKDFDEGAKYGVTGTPCFFVNGMAVEGAQPYKVFEEAIEKELKKK
jgi:protein-disulfide isomerase